MSNNDPAHIDLDALRHELGFETGNHHRLVCRHCGMQRTRESPMWRQLCPTRVTAAIQAERAAGRAEVTAHLIGQAEAMLASGKPTLAQQLEAERERADQVERWARRWKAAAKHYRENWLTSAASSILKRVELTLKLDRAVAMVDALEFSGFGGHCIWCSMEEEHADDCKLNAILEDT